MHRETSARADRCLEERGQTMAEYAVVLSVITLAIMFAIVGLGDAASNLIDRAAGFLGA